MMTALVAAMPEAKAAAPDPPFQRPAHRQPTATSDGRVRGSKTQLQEQAVSKTQLQEQDTSKAGARQEQGRSKAGAGAGAEPRLCTSQVYLKAGHGLFEEQPRWVTHAAVHEAPRVLEVLTFKGNAAMCRYRTRTRSWRRAWFGGQRKYRRFASHFPIGVSNQNHVSAQASQTVRAPRQPIHKNNQRSCQLTALKRRGEEDWRSDPAVTAILPYAARPAPRLRRANARAHIPRHMTDSS